MNKVKILHIVHDFLKGGIESFLYYLSQEQIKNEKLEIAILCLQDEFAISNQRIKKTNIKIYYIHIKPYDLNIKNYINILRLTNNFDIIHFHTFKPILNFALTLSNAKKIITVHSAGSIQRAKSFNSKIKKILFKYYLFNLTNGIAYNSHYTKSFWEENSIGKTNRKVIYNGVFFNTKFCQENCYIDYPYLKDKFIIGTTTRLISWKRVDLLINAFAEMKNKTPNIILLIIGDGPEKEKLISLSKGHGLSNQIFFLGYKGNITDFQSIIDICVFPSVSEPFGLVAIECLNLGKPILVMSDGGGITELIKKIEPQNIANSKKDLTEILEKSIVDSALFEKDITNKRIEYSQRFSVTQTENEYFEFYRYIISS